MPRTEGWPVRQYYGSVENASPRCQERKVSAAIMQVSTVLGMFLMEMKGAER
jgi:hypothetical protein